MRHYDHTLRRAGERFPRRATTADPVDRDVRDVAARRPCRAPTCASVGDVFSADAQPGAQEARSTSARSCGRSPTPTPSRWSGGPAGAAPRPSVVWDAHVGGIPVCLLGLESRTLARRGYVPADGPSSWTSGTLFPQSARKTARAVNAASGNRPLVVLANLSGFDGSPESMRHWQLEYGAEIGRAVTNFDGPIVFVVISRYHGGAFVVFSKRLNAGDGDRRRRGFLRLGDRRCPGSATVFAREVQTRAPRTTRGSRSSARPIAAGDGGEAGCAARRRCRA